MTVPTIGNNSSGSNNNGTSSGSSRAAKKRAKKKQKINHQQHSDKPNDNNNDTNNEQVENYNNSNEKKLNNVKFKKDITNKKKKVMPLPSKTTTSILKKSQYASATAITKSTNSNNDVDDDEDEDSNSDEYYEYSDDNNDDNQKDYDDDSDDDNEKDDERNQINDTTGRKLNKKRSTTGSNGGTSTSNNIPLKKKQDSSFNFLDVSIPDKIHKIIQSQQITLKDIVVIDEEKCNETIKDSTGKPIKNKIKESNNNKEGVQIDIDEAESTFNNKTNNIFFNDDYISTIQQRARCAFNFLLSPGNIDATEFYNTYWEKKPLCISCTGIVQSTKPIVTLDSESESTTAVKTETHPTISNPKKKQQQYDTNKHQHRFDGILSLQSIRDYTKQYENILQYGCDINVTRYCSIQRGQPKRRINLDPPPTTIVPNTDSNGTTTSTADNTTDTIPNVKYTTINHTFIWDQYDTNHATIRLLCPHKHNNTIHSLLSLLEQEWGCMVGANAYLTPSGKSQGFAPHYDDIEAFCLQLQGYKRWKVYAPIIDKGQVKLPRTSSNDFTEYDMKDQIPYYDITLGPGDILYMPRGWIHQGITLSNDDYPTNTDNNKGNHSLHLTISAYQNWSWIDYLEILLPEALEATANSTKSTMLRSGLPRNFLNYMGSMYDQRDDNLPDRFKLNRSNGSGSSSIGGSSTGTSTSIVKGNDSNKKKMMNGTKGIATDDSNETDDCNDADDDENDLLAQQLREMQETFRNETKKRIMRVAKEAMDMVDAACDQMGKRFLSDRLPPYLPNEVIECTSNRKSATTTATTAQDDERIQPTTLCRLVQYGIARLVIEDDNKAVVYHCNNNSRIYHEIPLSPLEYEIDDAPAIEQLLTTVEPYWIRVCDLLHESIDDKISITQSLYDEGIIAIINT